MSADGPAARAGLQRGDRIVQVNGTEVTVFDQIAGLDRGPVDKSVRLTDPARMLDSISRSALVPKVVTAPGPDGKPRIAGAGSVSARAVGSGSIPSRRSGKGTLATTQTIGASVSFIYELIVGRGGSPARLPALLWHRGNRLQDHRRNHGPHGTYTAYRQALSVSIGFINLLPIPILDGGHLVFYTIEAIRGEAARRPGPGAVIRLIGLMLIITITVLVLGHDLSRQIYGGLNGRGGSRNGLPKKDALPQSGRFACVRKPCRSFSNGGSVRALVTWHRNSILFGKKSGI